MNIVDKTKIVKRDWKNFIRWSNEEQFLFSNINFYSGLLSINKEKNVEENLIDFYIYNKFILEDRYDLDFPKKLRDIKGKNIEEWLENLFIYWFQELKDTFLLLLTFLNKLRKYKVSNQKNWELEYDLVKLYWEFSHNLRELKDKEYNNWLIYINENIYFKLKGFK